MEDDKPEHENQPALSDASDICQQLMDRYAKSTAPQHRHLVATAAAMRSLLAAEGLPLSPPAYFAASISAAADSLSAKPDATASAALLAFLAMVLPLVPPGSGVEAPRAAEAVSVLAQLLRREMGGAGLGAASVRAGVKCLGLLVGFCDLEDWGSVKLGFETLMKFSVDKRPKVRRRSQECLEKAFKLVNSSAVIKEASKLVTSMLKSYMPLALELCNIKALAKSAKEPNLESKYVEVLHMLNLLNLIVPSLHTKTRSRVLSEVNKLMKSHFSALTRHTLKTIETCFESSAADVISPMIENVVVSLLSFISSGDNIPSDSIVSAATLLKRALDMLRVGGSSSYATNAHLVCESVAGLLSSEAAIASHAATVLKELMKNLVENGRLLVDDNRQSEVEGRESTESRAVMSTCSVLESSLMKSDGKPNEYILVVISALFLELGGISYYYMKDILLQLADIMKLAAAGSKYNTSHVENCIGSAVIAMGPEKILIDLPISLNAEGLTCSNVWLVPILNNYVIGASLDYYMKHILRLAKSFREASRQVKRTPIGRDLQDHANSLWGLLPAFCRYPSDLYQNIGPLTEVLLKFLKRKDSLMHENVAISLQVLVNECKRIESKPFEVRGSLIECDNLPTYSKKIASKNVKALASHSTALLVALTDLFIDSKPAKRLYLKDAIGCLAFITDSTKTKEILMSLFERYKFINDSGEFGDHENQEESVDEVQRTLNKIKKDATRRIIMDLASSLVEGAKDDLIDLVYNFIKYSFQVTDGIGHQQAYHTLSKILEDHASFCSSRSIELVDLILSFKAPSDTDTLRSRFSCFHSLMVHILKVNSEEGNTKVFLIVNEIILTLKDAKDEDIRKEAYDVLIKTSSSLRDTPCSDSDSDSLEAPYQKLITMIMGYLTGASPHIKSGAISVLSVLIYTDANICLSVPDLIPTLLSLLQGRSLEVIKAALGFVKVLVCALQAQDLQNFLSSIVAKVLPWSSVSRNHFRSKVTIILEVLIRKCGIPAVESLTPEKYKGFVKSVIESRQNHSKSKEGNDGDKQTKNEEKAATRSENGKRKASDVESYKAGSFKHRKRMDERYKNSFGSKESNISSNDGYERRDIGAGQFGKKQFTKGQPDTRKRSRRNFDKGPRSGTKRKMNFDAKDGFTRKPTNASKFGKRKDLGSK